MPAVPRDAWTATDGGAGTAFPSAFHRSISELPDSVTVLYSGGLDSSLVAFCARELGRSVRLAVVGTPEAPDLDSAREGAGLLELPLSVTTLDRAGIRAAWRDPQLGLEGVPEPVRSIRLAFWLAMRSAPGTELLCGQGADELFAGYAHFRGQALEAAVRQREADLQRALESEWPWARRASAALGKRISAPFLDPRVLSAVASLPAASTLDREPPKRWLRNFARDHGLPGALVQRPKRALQYGSRVRQSLPDRASTGGTRPG